MSNDGPGRRIPAAAVQVELCVDDPEAGWQRAMEGLRVAIDHGARLVVLPELATCGYVFRDRTEARAAAAASRERMAQLTQVSADLPGVVVVCGHADADAEAGPVHNAASVVTDGHVLGTYRKVHLWDTEALVFTPGDEAPLVVDTPVGRVAVMICYDLEFPEWVRLARQAGAEVIAAPVNWPDGPRPRDQLPLDVAKARAVAGTYRIPVVVADRAGSERGVDWIGGSCLVTREGYLAAGPVLDGGRATVLSADLAPAGTTTISPRNDALADRRPALYREV